MESEKFCTEKCWDYTQSSLFFSVQRLQAGTFSFPPMPIYLCRIKERLSDGDLHTVNEEADR